MTSNKKKLDRAVSNIAEVASWCSAGKLRAEKSAIDGDEYLNSVDESAAAERELVEAMRLIEKAASRLRYIL